MSGNLTHQNLPKVALELNIDRKLKQPSSDDPWRDITALGDENIIKGIKLRTEIANRLASLGTALVKVESPVKGEIHFALTSDKTREAIQLTYSLIKDLQLFLESQY